MYVYRSGKPVQVYVGLYCPHCGYSWGEHKYSLTADLHEVSLAARFPVDARCPVCGVEEEQ